MEEESRDREDPVKYVSHYARTERNWMIYQMYASGAGEKAGLKYVQEHGNPDLKIGTYRRVMKQFVEPNLKTLEKMSLNFGAFHAARINRMEWIEREFLKLYHEAETVTEKASCLEKLMNAQIVSTAFMDRTDDVLKEVKARKLASFDEAKREKRLVERAKYGITGIVEEARKEKEITDARIVERQILKQKRIEEKESEET